MSGTQDWLLSRCEAERGRRRPLVELLTVQSVVAECVEDVVEAFRCNELAAARQVEVVRLEAEAGYVRETADAIASKLSAGEIKGIIALDQRAKRLDGECAMLKAEKEDLKAALEGAEGVKDFLGAKLRDAEETLKAAFEADETQRSQRRSDQEVINFLDARVRDLEAEAAGLRSRRDSVEADLSRDRDAAVKQLAHVVASRDADLDERDRGDKANREQKRPREGGQGASAASPRSTAARVARLTARSN
ncbi:hypothetical protein JL721_9600 [Aureococcus anophagefferens]|nr:hypothetical protein JL721_9600 [Aureococcus anophagefferens]